MDDVDFRVINDLSIIAGTDWGFAQPAFDLKYQLTFSDILSIPFKLI